MNYYEHHLGDWAAATGHLTWDEDMAYTRLLRAYYHAERPIPQGQQYRLAKASTSAQRRAVDAVLGEFFTLEADGCYHQKRADEEIARYQDKQAKAKRSAEARWSAQLPQSDGNANAMRTHTERNANSPPTAMRTHTERIPNAMRTQCEGNALQTPDTRHQTPTHPSDAPVLNLLPSVGGCGSAPNAAPPTPPHEAAPQAPPTPPPPFDGTNAEALNGRAVVALATGFELPAQWGFDAEALGFRTADVIREAERFRQYWTQGKGKGMRRSVKGWRQSWSNWLAKAERNTR